ncbi:pseudouridine synthase [uncultured Corynebacterium sp.]|uniref:pseudouridine synthase n=1 Tax=uncultured Corynebacterium sp. TaxID=159447 RepID=UPI00262C20C3|nr:pseudouridine synthase [uncultured Corynebacterium sp.]
MTPTARREGTPDRGKDEKFFLSNAKPAKHQNVSLNERRENAAKNAEAHPLEDNWWDEREDPVAPLGKAVEHEEQKRTPRRKPNEGIRLQKVLAQAGVASRRHSEVMIDEGRVEVNGKIIRKQGVRLDPNVDIIRVDGVRINVNEEHQYFALNKPRGMHTTMEDDLGRPCVGDLVADRIVSGQRLFHVGRLDADTEGLLLLTNDGELANRLMHPRYQVSKTYLATVLGEAKPALVRELKKGIELDDGIAKADYAQIVDTYQGQSLVRLEIHEGRKHIVRRMLKAAGFPVQRLVRTKIHTVQLGELKPGTMRALNDSELTALYKAVEM